MALVEYTSSDEDSNMNNRSSISSTSKSERAAPRITNSTDTPDALPPLPAKFHDLYASTKRLSTKDDPSLHGGRVRISPHVVGNWPTHIYLEWHPSTIERELLHQLIMTIQEKDCSFQVHSLLTSELKAPLPLHVSLSRPIQITTKQKDSISTSLRQAIECSSVQPFEISFTKLEWVSNFEKSRWFLILRTSSRHGNDELQSLLQICNNIVQRHGLLPLYEDPKYFRNVTSRLEKLSHIQSSNIATCSDENHKLKSTSNSTFNTFHVSIAWSLNPPSQNIVECMENTNEENFEIISKLKAKFEHIKLKIGNIDFENLMP
ncbi:hypothetical protein EV44_g6091 [Erysiphe necator]|uniref:U6 snRNA phosphodiesterase n=1 Tax=Uncinula necator TaxID=52586 RepID=A0A0B1P7P7_UNCNE|nr:hypothetical protein EV44_g6091 [Erysiphe necator]